MQFQYSVTIQSIDLSNHFYIFFLFWTDVWFIFVPFTIEILTVVIYFSRYFMLYFWVVGVVFFWILADLFRFCCGHNINMNMPKADESYPFYFGIKKLDRIKWCNRIRLLHIFCSITTSQHTHARIPIPYTVSKI